MEAACQPLLQLGRLAGTLPPASDHGNPLSLAVEQIRSRVGVGRRDLLAVRCERQVADEGPIRL